MKSPPRPDGLQLLPDPRVASSSRPEDFLKEQFELARARYGIFGTTFDQFAGHALEICRRRASTAEAGADPMPLLQSTNLPDLYLALSMGLRDPLAWSAFNEMIRNFITAASRRLTTLFTRDEQVQQELMGDLFLPARPGGPSRILSYNGAASLGWWVVMILRNRLVDLLRNRSPGGRTIVSLDAELAKRGESADARREAAAESATELQEEALLDIRKQSMLRESVPKAFLELSLRDRILLKMRYIDGLPQTTIASVFHVHKSRITRWLERAYRIVMKSVVEQLTREHGLDFKDATELVLYAARTEFGGEIERLLRIPSTEADIPPN